MEYLDELLLLKAELEEIIDKEIEILSNEKMPYLLKQIKISILEKEAAKLTKKYFKIEKLANDIYNKTIEEQDDNIVLGIRL